MRKLNESTAEIERKTRGKAANSTLEKQQLALESFATFPRTPPAYGPLSSTPPSSVTALAIKPDKGRAVAGSLCYFALTHPEAVRAAQHGTRCARTGAAPSPAAPPQSRPLRSAARWVTRAVPVAIVCALSAFFSILQAFRTQTRSYTGSCGFRPPAHAHGTLAPSCWGPSGKQACFTRGAIGGFRRPATRGKEGRKEVGGGSRKSKEARSCAIAREEQDYE